MANSDQKFALEALAQACDGKTMRVAMIYFEDLEVGSKKYFGTYEVTHPGSRSNLRQNDPQPFHLSDQEAAIERLGADLAASGWHIGGNDDGSHRTPCYQEGQAGLGSPGIDCLRWTKPVYPGDTLHVSGTITEKRELRSRPEMGSFRTHTVVNNQDGVQVMSFTSIVLIGRRPAD